MKTLDYFLIGAVAVGVLAFASRVSARDNGQGNQSRDALSVPPRATDVERAQRMWNASRPFGFYE